MSLIRLAVFLMAATQFASASMGAPAFLETGECATFSLMENFQLQKYVGRWYTIYFVPNNYVPGTKCIMDTMTQRDRKLIVVTRALDDDGERTFSHAKLILDIPKNRKKKPVLQLRAELIPDVPYHVIGTDYTSYSCVYSCYSLMGLRAELFWILSRSPSVSPENRQKCLDLLAEKGIDTEKMVEVQHTGCPRRHKEDQQQTTGVTIAKGDNTRNSSSDESPQQIPKNGHRVYNADGGSSREKEDPSSKTSSTGSFDDGERTLVEDAVVAIDNELGVVKDAAETGMESVVDMVEHAASQLLSGMVEVAEEANPEQRHMEKTQAKTSSNTKTNSGESETSQQNADSSSHENHDQGMKSSSNDNYYSSTQRPLPQLIFVVVQIALCLALP